MISDRHTVILNSAKLRGQWQIQFVWWIRKRETLNSTIKHLLRDAFVLISVPRLQVAARMMLCKNCFLPPLIG